MARNNSAITIEAYPVAKLPIPGWEAFFGVNDIEFHDLVFYVWIIRHDNRITVIDTGLPINVSEREALIDACRTIDERSTFHSIRLLDDVLDEAGVRPEEVTTIAITQTITYHTGGLRPGHFPNATIVFSRAGLVEMLTAPVGHPPVSMYFTDDAWSEIRTAAVEGRLVVTDEPHRLAEGITFETTGGHHPGSAAVTIEQNGDTITLLETAFFERNVAELLPIGIAENAAECRATIRKFSELGHHVIALHDPANAKRFSPHP